MWGSSCVCVNVLRALACSRRRGERANRRIRSPRVCVSVRRGEGEIEEYRKGGSWSYFGAVLGPTASKFNCFFNGFVKGPGPKTNLLGPGPPL